MVCTYLNILVALLGSLGIVNSYALKPTRASSLYPRTHHVKGILDSERSIVSRLHLNSLNFGSSFQLASIFDDDLPNLLGINPIEALILGGVLYFFYGPEALSDFAREAGAFIAKYTPIVQSLSQQIFDEFKDYFEEDKERSLLKKSGFDISKLPRRTSNIIERFAKGLESFSVAASSTSNAVVENEASDDKLITIEENTKPSPLKVDAIIESDGGIARRKKKKEVLGVKEDLPTDNITNSALNADTAISIDAPGVGNENQYIDENGFDDSQLSVMTEYPFPPDSNEDYLSRSNSIETSTIDTSSAMSKFQLQLNGEWNKKVLDQEKQFVASNSPTFEPNFTDYSTFGDVPGEVSAFDAIDNNALRGISSDNLEAAKPAAPTFSVLDPGYDIIREFDEDYMRLRNKLLNALQSVNIKASSSSTDSTIDKISIDPIEIGLSLDRNIAIDDPIKPQELRKRYWPPNNRSLAK